MFILYKMHRTMNIHVLLLVWLIFSTVFMHEIASQTPTCLGILFCTSAFILLTETLPSCYRFSVPKLPRHLAHLCQQPSHTSQSLQ
jgi:hypothetical protein